MEEEKFEKPIFLIFGKQGSGKSTLAETLRVQIPDFFPYDVPPITENYIHWFENLKEMCGKRKIADILVLHAGHSPRLDVEQLFYCLFVKNHFSPREQLNIALTFEDFLKSDVEEFWSELDKCLKEKDIRFTTKQILRFDSEKEKYKLPVSLQNKKPQVDITFQPGFGTLNYKMTIAEIYRICFVEKSGEKPGEKPLKKDPNKLDSSWHCHCTLL